MTATEPVTLVTRMQMAVRMTASIKHSFFIASRSHLYGNESGCDNNGRHVVINLTTAFMTKYHKTIRPNQRCRQSLKVQCLQKSPKVQRHGRKCAHYYSGVTRGGVTPEGKKLFVGKFTKNSGETRLDR